MCLATSGPGVIHLLNGLYDARMDHQPVVAIVGPAARPALGGDYQQEVDLRLDRPPRYQAQLDDDERATPLLMVGSSFPYSEFLPEEEQARGVQIDIEGRMLGLRHPMEVNLVGDSAETLRALLPRLRQKTDHRWRKLTTIAKYWKEWSDPRLVVLVLNNRDLNQVTWEMRAVSGNPKLEASQDIPDFPYACYAELLGLQGIKVEHPDEVGPASIGRHRAQTDGRRGLHRPRRGDVSAAHHLRAGQGLHLRHPQGRPGFRRQSCGRQSSRPGPQ